MNTLMAQKYYELRAWLQESSSEARIGMAGTWGTHDTRCRVVEWKVLPP